MTALESAHEFFENSARLGAIGPAVATFRWQVEVRCQLGGNIERLARLTTAAAGDQPCRGIDIRVVQGPSHERYRPNAQRHRSTKCAEASARRDKTDDGQT